MVSPKNSTVNASRDVSLACQAEAYPANLTYSWFQDSVNVFHIRWGSGVWVWGTGGKSLRSCLAEQGLDPSPHMPCCRRLQSRVRISVDGSLWLQAAQPDDAGCYTCVPSNGLLHPPSASAYLTVLCKPDPSSPHSLLPLPWTRPSSSCTTCTTSHCFFPRPGPGDGNAS